MDNGTVLDKKCYGGLCDARENVLYCKFRLSLNQNNPLHNNVRSFNQSEIKHLICVPAFEECGYLVTCNMSKEWNIIILKEEVITMDINIGVW